jgi:hypothetical protein
MIEFLTQHQFWAAVALYWIYSAAVSSMPAPGPNGSPGYVWLYRFLHTLAGNLTTAFGGKVPGFVSGFLTTAVLLLSLSACAHYVVHPGALNPTDSAAYDALLIAQSTIDQAKVAFTAGQLPVTAKDPLNTLIASYNVAHQSWLTYRGAVATKSPPDVYYAQLNADILNLTNAIQAFKEVR